MDQRSWMGGGGGYPTQYPPSMGYGSTMQGGMPPSSFQGGGGMPPATFYGGGAPSMFNQQQFYGGGMMGGGMYPQQQQQYSMMYSQQQQQQYSPPSVMPTKSKGTKGWLSYYGQPSPDEMFMLREWFQAVDQDRSGTIEPEELRTALAAAGEQFDIEAVNLMVGMFDDDGNGRIDMAEFISLFRYIGAIRSSFDAFDTRGRGQLDVNEISQAIGKANFNLPLITVQALFQKFDKRKKNLLSFAEYLEMAMYLGNLRSTFEKYDPLRSGSLRMDLDQFTNLMASVYEPNL